MQSYSLKPKAFLVEIGSPTGIIASTGYCAGFELKKWRCEEFARHLINWLPEFALAADELDVDHSNAYQKLREAAVRVYTSAKHSKRGEVGEIALHAICRSFFETTPISPRVFYKSSSNEVIKSFDLVHARQAPDGDVELWLGESKLYADSISGIKAAIKSVEDHLDQGFLNNQKLLLGPQIPKSVPNYEKLRQLLSSESSLDKLFKAAVFTISVLGNSEALSIATEDSPTYRAGAIAELVSLRQLLEASNLHKQVRLQLIYVPLSTKDLLVAEFDKYLKGLQ